MTNPKTVKEVLEELVIQCGGHWLDHEDISISQSQLHLDALYKAKYLAMLPEEKDITYGHSTDIAFGNGFNSAIQEIKRRIG